MFGEHIPLFSDHSKDTFIQFDILHILFPTLLTLCPGVYGALVAVAVFLVVCGLGWLFYRLFWVKYYAQVLKVEDKYVR